jgi:hypothetical protein
MVLVYGFMTIGMFYLWSFIAQVSPTLTSFFTFVRDPSYSWVILIYPLSFSYIIATMTAPTQFFPSLTSVQSVVAIITSVFYIALAYFAFRKGRNALRQLALGEIGKAPRLDHAASDIQIRVEGIFSSMFKKDLKLASRNVSYAMFLVIPILSILLFTAIVTRSDVVRLRDLAIALLYSSFPASLFCMILVEADSKGVAILRQLPISTKEIVRAKSLSTTVLASSIPATLFVVSLFKLFSTPLSLGVAMIQIGGIYSGALIATTLFCVLYGKGRVPSVSIETNLPKAILTVSISVIFTFLPIGIMATVLLFLVHDYITMLAIMGAVTAIEIIAASLIANIVLKD